MVTVDPAQDPFLGASSAVAADLRGGAIGSGSVLHGDEEEGNSAERPRTGRLGRPPVAAERTLDEKKIESGSRSTKGKSGAEKAMHAPAAPIYGGRGA